VGKEDRKGAFLRVPVNVSPVWFWLRFDGELTFILEIILQCPSARMQKPRAQAVKNANKKIEAANDMDMTQFPCLWRMKPAPVYQGLTKDIYAKLIGNIFQIQPLQQSQVL